MSDQPTELELLMRESAATTTHHAEGEDGEASHKKHKRRHHGGHAGHAVRDLNLTAMMDMMTIILVFLLKNYASTPENVNITDDLSPPRSVSKIPMDVSVAITITKKGLLVDDKPVVSLNNFTIANEPASQQTQPIAKLKDVLDTKVGDMKALADKGGAPFEGKILIVADETVPYAFLMRVLYTAGTAQFAQYKLVVRSKNVALTEADRAGG